MNEAVGHADLIGTATTLNNPSAKNMKAFGFLEDGRIVTYFKYIAWLSSAS